MAKIKVTQKLTLSKYSNGSHTFNDLEYGDPSFSESMSPVHSLINSLYIAGVPLGSEVEVTMTAKTSKRMTKGKGK